MSLQLTISDIITNPVSIFVAPVKKQGAKAIAMVTLNYADDFKLSNIAVESERIVYPWTLHNGKFYNPWNISKNMKNVLDVKIRAEVNKKLATAE